MADTTPRPHRKYPWSWPWGHPSILVALADDQRPQTNSWLDVDLGKDDDSTDGVESDSEYVPSESSGRRSEGSRSDESASDSDEDISESELAYIRADAQTGWPSRSSPTPSLKELQEEEDLTRQIEELVKAEEDTAAAYNPDEIVSLITQFYELLITMGHYSEGSLRYPPHTDPPVNVELAVQLGYDPAVISLMQRLPYLNWNVNGDYHLEILRRTHLADYTREEHLREGRHPYPYMFDGSPDIDAWLLPFMLSGREGWNVFLDTRLGVVRAYCTDGWPPENTVEFRRHGKVPKYEEPHWKEVTWTEYRRAPLVPARRYFEDLIYAYRSLARLPIIDPDRSDPEPLYGYPETYPNPIAKLEIEEQQTLLALYRECGWPDEWRRAEFLEKWAVKEKDLDSRSREAWQQYSKELED